MTPFHARLCVGHVDLGGHHLADGIVGESCHLPEELPVAKEIRPEHLWDGEDPLGVRDVGENLVLE